MALKSTDVEKATIQISGVVINGTTVKVSYKALPGSNPKAMGYFVAIWQGSQIQNITAAKQVLPLTNDSQDGDLNFAKLELSKLDYIIGFGVNQDADGKAQNTVCATMLIPATAKVGDKLVPVLSDLEVPEDGIGTNSLVALYTTPLYNTPKTNGNWIALFEGPFTANCYSGGGLIKSDTVGSNKRKDSTTLDDIPGGLIRFETYTLVYGMSLKEDAEPNFSSIINYYTFSI